MKYGLRTTLQQGIKILSQVQKQPCGVTLLELKYIATVLLLCDKHFNLAFYNIS